MKTIAVLMAITFLFVPMAVAEQYEAVEEEEVVDQGVARCPLVTMTDQSSCLGCHEIIKNADGFKMSVKDETWRKLPNPYYMSIIQHDGKDALYCKLESINSDMIHEAYEYMVKHGMTYFDLEIFSPGGSVIEAWRIQSMIREYEEKHGIITATSTRGLAASAGFIILASGTKGYRSANKYSEILCHELWTVAWLKVETPASTADNAKIMQHFQDNINNWLAEVSNVGPDYIADKIHKKDWWMWGEEAMAEGFIDHYSWGDAPVMKSAHSSETEGN